MGELKKVVAIGWGFLVFVLLLLAIAGMTDFLPHNDEKFYVALTGVATVVLAAGTLLFMWRQEMSSKRVAGFQMLVQLDAQYESERMRATRSSAAPLLIGGARGMPPGAEDILDFFEMLAFYTREDHLDFKLVSNGFSLQIRCYWFALKDLVNVMRQQYGDKTLYEHLEWLNSELEKENGDSTAPLDKPRVDRFLRSETGTIVPDVVPNESDMMPDATDTN